MPDERFKSGARTRHVLTDVPRVGFYPDVRQHEPERCPEDIIFPSCMRAVMQYLGHPEYDYTHFVGVTGAGGALRSAPPCGPASG